MKTTGRCTKCQHGQVWRIDRIGVKERAYKVNMPIQAVDRRTDEAFPRTYDAGCVDAYVCAACGFSELYWRELEGLQPSAKAGVHLVPAKDGSQR